MRFASLFVLIILVHSLTRLRLEVLLPLFKLAYVSSPQSSRPKLLLGAILVLKRPKKKERNEIINFLKELNTDQKGLIEVIIREIKGGGEGEKAILTLSCHCRCCVILTRLHATMLNYGAEIVSLVLGVFGECLKSLSETPKGLEDYLLGLAEKYNCKARIFKWFKMHVGKFKEEVIEVIIFKGLTGGGGDEVINLCVEYLKRLEGEGGGERIGGFVERIFGGMREGGGEGEVYVQVLERVIPLVWEMAEDEVEYEVRNRCNRGKRLINYINSNHNKYIRV